jgi:hypothetical protein
MRPERPIVSLAVGESLRDAHAAALRAHGTSVAHLSDEWRMAALKNDAQGGKKQNDSCINP